MLYGNLIPVEMMELPEPEPLHINDLADQTAGAIAATELRRDRTHCHISAAAAYLAKQERGHLRYGGMLHGNRTIWLDADGSAEIVNTEEVTLWVAPWLNQ